MSLPDNFVIVDGLLTVEKILRPSYIVRRRIDTNSLTSPYVWVATIADMDDRRCEIKGYLARENCNMNLSERRAIKRIVAKLNFLDCGYARADPLGGERMEHKFADGLQRIKGG